MFHIHKLDYSDQFILSQNASCASFLARRNLKNSYRTGRQDDQNYKLKMAAASDAYNFTNTNK